MQPMNHAAVDGFGVGGLTLDIPESSRTFQQLSSATNVRMLGGEVGTIPAKIEAIALDQSKTPAYASAFWLSDDSGGHIVCYTDGSIAYIGSDSVEVDVTPTPAPATSTYWYSTQINDIFVLTNGLEVPYQITQDDVLNGNPFIEMPNWPATYRAHVIEAYKSHLVAADITISGEKRRSLVKWSSPLSPGDTEFFWDYTDPTQQAGENQLAVAGRSINALQQLRDNLIIYFDRSVWRMSYVGGDFVMSFAKVFDDDGCISPHGATDYDGRAVVFGHRDIYVHDGFTKNSISDGKISTYFYRNARLNRGVFTTFYPQQREVYALFTSSSDVDDYDIALIYNIDHNAFTVMQLPGPNNAGDGRCMYMGPPFNVSTLTYDEAGVDGITYDGSTNLSYSALNKTDEGANFYLLSGEGKSLQLMDEAGGDCYGESKVYLEVARTKLAPLFPTTGDKIRYVSRVFPRMTGQGEVELSVGHSMQPSGAMNWTPWRRFNIETDYAVDTRAAGRYIGLRVKLPGGEARQFSITGFDIEVMMPHAGRR